MKIVPFSRGLPDPRYKNNFLDSCAFDPKCLPEHEAAQAIRALGRDDQVILTLAHSNQKEIDHPNTPADMKREAREMNRTIEIALIPEEKSRKANIHAILTGNGKPEKYAEDAMHIFEAGKWGAGYFITTDKRILAKRDELRQLSRATILKPTEWLSLFQNSDQGTITEID